MAFENFASTWKHLPELIDPVVFTLGPLSVRWYSLMYLVAFATIFALLKKRLNKRELAFPENFNLEELFIFFILGLLIGGRIGYLLIYDLGNFIAGPIETLLPFENGSFTGYYGASYHGGLVGIVLAGLLFCRIRKISFTKLSDFVVPAVPLGYFFGRIGNFLNGELFGRQTESKIGMLFPADGLSLLRHPSQIYEALFEGLIIFLIIWPLRNNKKVKGRLLSLYLLLYGIARLMIEFFRQPDPHLGLVAIGLSMGQLLSSAMIALAILLWIVSKKNTPDGHRN